MKKIEVKTLGTGEADFIKSKEAIDMFDRLADNMAKIRNAMNALKHKRINIPDLEISVNLSKLYPGDFNNASGVNFEIAFFKKDQNNTESGKPVYKATLVLGCRETKKSFGRIERSYSVVLPELPENSEDLADILKYPKDQLVKLISTYKKKVKKK